MLAWFDSHLSAFFMSCKLLSTRLNVLGGYQSADCPVQQGTVNCWTNQGAEASGPFFLSKDLQDHCCYAGLSQLRILDSDGVQWLILNAGKKIALISLLVARHKTLRSPPKTFGNKCTYVQVHLQVCRQTKNLKTAYRKRLKKHPRVQETFSIIWHAGKWSQIVLTNVCASPLLSRVWLFGMPFRALK